jgi:hypothetical protein
VEERAGKGREGKGRWVEEESGGVEEKGAATRGRRDVLKQSIVLPWRRCHVACDQHGYNERVHSDDSGHDNREQRLHD